MFWCCYKRTTFKNNDINDYDFIENIGYGTFGDIKLVLKNNKYYAMKITMKYQPQNANEIKYLKLCNHPNIISLIDVKETDVNYKIILKYYPNGDLFDYSYNNTLDEMCVKKIIFNILLPLKYMQNNKLVHLDLKPENLLLGGKNKFQTVLTDLGCVHKFNKINSLQKLNFIVGTKYYNSPEIKSLSFHSNSDVWNIGLITDILLTQELNFDRDIHDIFNPNVINFILFKLNISEDAKDFISECLIVNPNNRSNIDQLLEHVWLKK